MDKVAVLERLWFLPITVFLLLFFIEITSNFKKKSKKYSFDNTWMVIKSAHYGSFRAEYYNFLANNLFEGTSSRLKARRIRQKCISIIVNNSELEPWYLEKSFKANERIGSLEPHTRIYHFLKNPEKWVKNFLGEQPFLTRNHPIRRKKLMTDQFIEIIQEFKESWNRKTFNFISDINYT
ncbi:MAG: hypothetical protein KAR35_00590 [Candidatus Heimdallarchaeota archaeon]|nr:hypothetical protein [Candidatus Heimdallarchaeota archaeon]MCK5047849.1 hypothetical protein [Candidatus Heimdallarchaeota archaeon]